MFVWSAFSPCVPGTLCFPSLFPHKVRLVCWNIERRPFLPGGRCTWGRAPPVGSREATTRALMHKSLCTCHSAICADCGIECAQRFMQRFCNPGSCSTFKSNLLYTDLGGISGDRTRDLTVFLHKSLCTYHPAICADNPASVTRSRSRGLPLDGRAAPPTTAAGKTGQIARPGLAVRGGRPVVGGRYPAHRGLTARSGLAERAPVPPPKLKRAAGAVTAVHW